MSTEIFYSLTKLVDTYGCDYVVQHGNFSVLVFVQKTNDDIRMASLLDYQTPELQIRTQLITNFIDTVTEYLSNPEKYPSVVLDDEIKCQHRCENDTLVLEPITIAVQPGVDQLMFFVGKVSFDDKSCLFPVSWCKPFVIQTPPNACIYIYVYVS